MSSAKARSGPLYRRLFAALAAIEDGTILRTAFFLMLSGTIAVLYVDYSELGQSNPDPIAAPGQPTLPLFDPIGPLNPGGNNSPALTSDTQTLRAPLTMALTAGRVLGLTGTIDPGAADRFMAEIAARGEYIDSVVLNSPGGSVSDALIIGALIRKHKFSTSVAAGGLCASSCPLVFAGGLERVASRDSAIGVHQVYAAPRPDAPGLAGLSTGTAMADAQKTTALITRHLIDLGVDTALWLHALETPPGDLYFLSPEEMLGFKLATRLAETPADPALSAEAAQ